MGDTCARGRTVREMTDYAKQRLALRYWLLGRGFTQASRAMDFAEGYHCGTRKDGQTPEFAHQVAIAGYLRTLLPHLLFGEETLCAAFLHDVREDYDVSDEEIRTKFGDRVADAVDAVTKTFRGVRRDDTDLFVRIGKDPIASILKPADRGHNQDTMVGVFTVEKMAAYVTETETLFLPMIKRARRGFPEQEPAYENAKHLLVSQVSFV
jgi:(p)ppGpp synthase/HD superfamily hydrolase